MEHNDAIRELSVEKYLLGELSGDSRNLFEEHLFECQLCAADLTSGVILLEGTRRQLAAAQREKAAARPWDLPAWLSPVWMLPALAACLILLVFQSFVVVPGVRRQLAEASTPAVLNTLALTGGQARGSDLPRVAAPKGGSFLLAVDIPVGPDYASYLCSLYAPNGNMVWSGKVTADQAKDALQIHVPFLVTEPGQNTLVVQGMRRDSPDAKMDTLATDKFVLEALN